MTKLYKHRVFVFVFILDCFSILTIFDNFFVFFLTQCVSGSKVVAGLFEKQRTDKKFCLIKTSDLIVTSSLLFCKQKMLAKMTHVMTINIATTHNLNIHTIQVSVTETRLLLHKTRLLCFFFEPIPNNILYAFFGLFLFFNLFSFNLKICQ